MKVYFDKQNLLAFIKSSSNAKFEDCNRMLKNHCKVEFNFRKDDLQSETEDNDVIKQWLTQCTDDFKSIWQWNSVVFPPRPISAVTINGFSRDQLRAVYLIADEKINLIKDKGLLIVSELGKEVDTLSQLWFNDLQYQINCFDEISDWSKLNRFLSPCTDVVLVDQFILLHEDKLEHNLYPLLCSLCSKAKNASVNVVIFSLNQDPVDNSVPNWNKIVEQIRNRVSKNTTVKPGVTIVSATKDTLGEHDRSIFTNYKLISSGDSFNYFDENWNKATRGRYLNVYSLSSKENNNTAERLISDLQGVYDKVCILNKNLIHRYQHSKSNFINLHE